jgi:hypothetical protein
MWYMYDFYNYQIISHKCWLKSYSFINTFLKREILQFLLSQQVTYMASL